MGKITEGKIKAQGKMNFNHLNVFVGHSRINIETWESLDPNGKELGESRDSFGLQAQEPNSKNSAFSVIPSYCLHKALKLWSSPKSNLAQVSEVKISLRFPK